MSNTEPFNPLDKANLGISVAQALLARDPIRLDKVEKMTGAGVYALYYSGPFKPYAKLAKRNSGGRFTAPIYVGKAENKKRKGKANGATRSTVLFNRLQEHGDSIRCTKTLRIEDFHCRFLVVDDIWVPLGETLLIAKFAPLWNSTIDGFGNHDPGSGRYKGMRPRWDVLHPGRVWAVKCAERLETAEQIASEVEEYLRAIPSEPPRFYTGEPVPPEYLLPLDDSEQE